VLEPYTRDLRALRREIEAFGALLAPETPLVETAHILPFLRRSRHLAAAFGFANRALIAPDLLALGRPLFGSFRCDVAVGNAAARQFTLVELEDARENSLFEPVKGRDSRAGRAGSSADFLSSSIGPGASIMSASRARLWKRHSARQIRGFTTYW
jgi:hypothetical protein